MPERTCDTCGRVGPCDDEDGRMCSNHNLWIPKPELLRVGVGMNVLATCPEHGKVGMESVVVFAGKRWCGYCLARVFVEGGAHEVEMKPWPEEVK